MRRDLRLLQVPFNITTSPVALHQFNRHLASQGFSLLPALTLQSLAGFMVLLTVRMVANCHVPCVHARMPLDWLYEYHIDLSRFRTDTTKHVNWSEEYL